MITKRLKQLHLYNKNTESNNIEHLFCKGNALYDLKKYQEAITAYDKVLTIAPKYVPAWLNKGKALSMLGKYRKAVNSYEKAFCEAMKNGIYLTPEERLLCVIVGKDATALRPEDSSAWFAKGVALDILKKHQKAIDSFDKAIEIDPKCFCAWCGKGRVFFELGKYQESVDAYSKSIEISPETASWNSKGVALGKLGKYQEAIAAYDKALELDPKNATGSYNRDNVTSNHDQKKKKP